MTPHVAQNMNRNGGSAVDDRTTRHAGYEISQRKRKCIEQCFGWGKFVGPIRPVTVQGLDKVDQRSRTYCRGSFRQRRFEPLHQVLIRVQPSMRAFSVLS